MASESRAQDDYSEQRPGEVIENPRDNDVLFGRGAPYIRWRGNIQFREHVQKRKAEYLATRRHVDKNVIAREIIDFIRNERRGRFLIKESTVDPSGSHSIAWIEPTESLIMEKVKQTLRDKQDGTKRRAKPVSGRAAKPSSCQVKTKRSDSHEQLSLPEDRQA